MIRLAERADVPAMLEIYAPYVRETTVTFEYATPSAEEFAGRFDRISARYPWLVWEASGRILGYAYADAAFSRAAYATGMPAAAPSADGCTAAWRKSSAAAAITICTR